MKITENSLAKSCIKAKYFSTIKEFDFHKRERADLKLTCLILHQVLLIVERTPCLTEQAAESKKGKESISMDKNFNLNLKRYRAQNPEPKELPCDPHKER